MQALNLEIAPQDIDPDAPLYGEGLGLDSIDILEVALIVSKKYGVQLRADSQDNHKIFRSLRHLAELHRDPENQVTLRVGRGLQLAAASVLLAAYTGLSHLLQHPRHPRAWAPPSPCTASRFSA